MLHYYSKALTRSILLIEKKSREFLPIRKEKKRKTVLLKPRRIILFHMTITL